MNYKHSLWLVGNMFLDSVVWLLGWLDRSLFLTKALKAIRFCLKNKDKDWDILMLLTYGGFAGIIIFFLSIYVTCLHLDWRGPAMCILGILSYEFSNFHFRRLIKEKQEKFNQVF